MGENGHVTEVASLNGERMVMLRRMVSLMEGEWSCQRFGQCNGGRMVMSEVVV